MWKPPQPAIEFVLQHLDDAYRRLLGWLDGLTEAEFNWRPVENVWHLERREGYGTIAYSWIPPQPAPFTTIAWRAAHIAASLILTTDHAFGERQKRLEHLRLPLDVPGMIEYLGDAYSGFSKAVATLEDQDLPKLRYTEWGEQRTTAAIVGSAILHIVEHGAQIATLRELYRHWGGRPWVNATSTSA